MSRVAAISFFGRTSTFQAADGGDTRRRTHSGSNWERCGLSDNETAE